MATLTLKTTTAVVAALVAALLALAAPADAVVCSSTYSGCTPCTTDSARQKSERVRACTRIYLDR